MRKLAKHWPRILTLFSMALISTALLQKAVAQDQSDQDDPPSRVARLGYIQGSVSFQPAGESEWVEAAPNRPMTTGDQLWADKDSRAELSLGASVIYLNSNTGVSFLNLDDNTAQVQLSSGSISVRVRRLDRDDVFEIDTPNQAFSIHQPGLYRIEASDDGSYSVVSIRQGEGESTGNGQTYTLHVGQRATFEGTDTLNAQVQDIGAPDDFDNWSNGREHRYETSRSAQYVSHDVVGYEDLDDNGDWSPEPGNGNVWYPHVAAGWAPYRQGHWAWIDPWGWTWVDDEPWGYAPFHYGRWLSIRGRWGWVPGPPAVRPVYAPALVVFVGGGGGLRGNMGWFPLGPREVYVPSYRVSRGYVDRVNVSNTTVNTTTVTNVYNTTIVNKTTNITNVTYVNRNVSGAVTAVPQRTFSSGQSVGRSAVAVNARDIASAPMNARATVAPTSNSVLGVHARTANRVAAPPAAVASRAVVAKAKAPPPPVPFAARQQALAAHPGQPIARQEMARMQPARATAAAPRPMVKQAPPGKPATATIAKPGSQPGNRPGNTPAANERPGANPAQPNQPGANNQPTPNNRATPNPAEPNKNSAEPPARNDRTPAAQPNNRPTPNQPAPNNHPPAAQPDNRPAPNPTQPNRPAEPAAGNDRTPAAQPNNRPTPNATQPNRPAEPPARNDRAPAAQPNNRPTPNATQPNRPAEPPARNDRTPAAQPNNRPTPNAAQPNRPAEPPARNDRTPAAQPNNRPTPNAAQPNRPTQPPARNDRPAAQPNNRPEANRPDASPRTPPAQAHPAQPQQRPQTPEEKKKQEEKKKNEKPNG